MKNIILFIILVLSVTVSSVFWKISSNQIIKMSSGSNLLFKQFTNPSYLLGWFFYFLATFLWIYLLGKYEYSKLYPVYVGVCIIMSLIIGLVFFKENTGMIYKIIGSALNLWSSPYS